MEDQIRRSQRKGLPGRFSRHSRIPANEKKMNWAHQDKYIHASWLDMAQEIREEIPQTTHHTYTWVFKIRTELELDPVMI